MAKLFGMVHLPRLRLSDPRSPPLDSVIQYTLSEVKKLTDLGFDGVVIENFGDTPFQKSSVSTAVTSKMAIIIHEVQKHANFQIGLNILRNASVQAMELASLLNIDFIRSNIWEAAYVTDQGIIEGVAFDVIQKKHQLRSNVKVYADIHVKHATPLSDFSLYEAAEQAIGRGGADNIIISGRGTGDPVNLQHLEELNSHNIYPLIGSGTTIDTLEKYSGKVSAIIVGTAIKTEGVTSPIDVKKAEEFVNAWSKHFS